MNEEELGIESVIQHVQTKKAVHCVEDLYDSVAANLMAIEALYEAADRAARALSMNVAGLLVGEIKAPQALMVNNIDKAGILTVAAWRQNNPGHPGFSRLGVKDDSGNRLYEEDGNIYLVLRVTAPVREVDGYMQPFVLAEEVKECYNALGRELDRTGAGICERPQLHVHREAGITRVHASTLAGRKIWPVEEAPDEADVK
jgi:hypothetical protein